MKVVYKTAENEIATVYIARTEEGKMIEFVDSSQPPFSRKEKWIIIISSLFGCPVGCRFCDAGMEYRGKLSLDQILFQIDYVIQQRCENRIVDSDQFKIQFARMGDPAFNQNVLEALERIPEIFYFKNFIPSVSTVAPEGCDSFFEKLIDLREKIYPEKFQLQFSIHSTDDHYRDNLIPVKKWSLKSIADYGCKFYRKNSRKITLNFALLPESIIDPGVLRKFFNPEMFLIKITPVNPTVSAIGAGMHSYVYEDIKNSEIVSSLRNANYDVILSIGELEENKIGSNCGQFISAVRQKNAAVLESYTYPLEKV